MPTPDQLIYKKHYKDPEALDLPGVDPITPDSFAPNGPPDPGVNTPSTVMAVQPPVQAPQGMPGPMESSLDQAPAAQPMASGPALPPVPEFKTSPLSVIETPQETGPIFSEYIKQSDLADQERMKNNLEKSQIHQKSAEEQRLSLRHSDQEWAEAQAEQKRREAKMDEAIAKGRAMSIDPNRYWNRAGTFSNIMSALSVGLGAFGSGMTHGATGNPGLALVNQAIEHDISAQKADIDNYWSSVKQQFQLDDTVFNRALANQNFRANQRLAAVKLVDSELAAVEAKSQNPLVQKAANDMRLELQMKQIGLRQQSAVAIAEMEKQRRAAQAAIATNNAKLAEKRQTQVNTDAKQIQDAEGIPYEEAVQRAQKLADDNPMYSSLRGTQYASIGQRYQHQENAIDNIIKAQQKEYTKMGKAKSIAEIAKTHNGDLAAASEEYDQVMNHPDEYKAKIKSQIPGAILEDPYKSKASNVGSNTAIDPLTGAPTIINKNNKASAVRAPDGQIYIMADPTIANDWRKSEAIALKAKNATNTLMELAKKHPNGDIEAFDQDEARQFHEAQTMLTAYYGNQGNAGTMGAGDVIRFQAVVADPFKIVKTGDAEKQAKDMMNGIDVARNATFQGYSGLKENMTIPGQKSTQANTSGDPFTRTDQYVTNSGQSGMGGAGGTTGSNNNYAGTSNQSSAGRGGMGGAGGY